MRIVLSRKGYDSAYGGCPSPVFRSSDEDWNGRMFSLPIPEVSNGENVDTGRRKSGIRYPKGLPVRAASPRGMREDFFVHHDPDIRREIHRTLPENWLPMFGQCGSAASHLRGYLDNKVEANTLFVFFGLFQDFERKEDGAWKPVPGSRPYHAIWGYMQCYEIAYMDREFSDRERILDSLCWHPHCNIVGRSLHATKNTLYMGRPNSSLVFGEKVLDMPSYGIFRYGDMLRLTGEKESVSRWREDALPWLDAEKKEANMTYHDRNSFKEGIFQSTCRGQEFIVTLPDIETDEKALDWLVALSRLVETRDWGGILE